MRQDYLNAGLSLAEISNHMGWSIRYAANVIEHYARVSPDETDTVLVKLAKDGGEYRNRTGVHGFAIRCVTTPPTRLEPKYWGLGGIRVS